MKILRTSKILPLLLGRSSSCPEEEELSEADRPLRLAICGLLVLDREHNLTLSSLAAMKLGGRPVGVEQVRVKKAVMQLVDEHLVSIEGERISQGDQLLRLCGKAPARSSRWTLRVNR